MASLKGYHGRIKAELMTMLGERGVAHATACTATYFHITLLNNAMISPCDIMPFSE